MANPNVPASQAVAAENSAPNASVTAQQPAQTGQAAPATAAPMAAAQPAARPAGAAQPAVSVDSAKAASDRKAELDKEQSTLKSLNSKTEGMDYFEQQEEFAKVFEEREGEDSFRRAARIEREREAAASAGDPTRDPVAKQAAMDKNFVAPGAKADAQKIKDIGAKEAKK